MPPEDRDGGVEPKFRSVELCRGREMCGFMIVVVVVCIMAYVYCFVKYWNKGGLFEGVRWCCKVH